MDDLESWWNTGKAKTKPMTAEDWKEAFDFALKCAYEYDPGPPTEYISYSEYLRRIKDPKDR